MTGEEIEWRRQLTSPRGKAGGDPVTGTQVGVPQLQAPYSAWEV